MKRSMELIKNGAFENTFFKGLQVDAWSMPDEIDMVVSAEIPDKEQDPEIYWHHKTGKTRYHHH